MMSGIELLPSLPYVPECSRVHLSPGRGEAGLAVREFMGEGKAPERVSVEGYGRHQGPEMIEGRKKTGSWIGFV